MKLMTNYILIQWFSACNGIDLRNIGSDFSAILKPQTLLDTLCKVKEFLLLGDFGQR